MKNNTRLAKNLGEQVLVNSAHHQAVKDLGEGLISGPESVPDGLIEAVEGKEGFVIGVQWHPERLLDIPYMDRLFKDFIEACRSNVKSSPDPARVEG